MSIQDRNERYSRIRRWLDYPFAQRPRPNQILGQMLTDEQWLNLKLTNENEAWNLIEHELETTAGESVYTIAQPITGTTRSGKIYFVIRQTDNEEAPYVPIPFNDMSHLEYGKMPEGVNDYLGVAEKVSVYRTDMQNQERRIVIYPTPQEVLTYKIYFYTGEIDRAAVAMDESGLVTELTDFIDLRTSLALLPYCEWYDDDERNERKQQRLATGLQAQYATFEPVFDDYIDNMNADTAFDLDHVFN